MKEIMLTQGQVAIVDDEDFEKEAEAAYDLIDRYLRNNLDDPEYAAMSAALESCYRALLYPQNDRMTAMLGPQKPMKAGEVPDA